MSYENLLSMVRVAYTIYFDKANEVFSFKRPYEPDEHPNDHSDARTPASPLTNEQLPSLKEFMFKLKRIVG